MPSHRPVDHLRQLLVLCATVAARSDDGNLSDEDRDALSLAGQEIERAWKTLATYAAEATGATVDTEHAGYVRRSRARLPFFLAEDVPSNEQLEELFDLGLTIRVASDGTICLSGSTALLGSLRFVGDIDFCEYATASPDTANDIAGHVDAHARRTVTPLCGRVKVAAPLKWSRTVPAEWDSSQTADLGRMIAGGAYHLKLDFVVATRAVGTVEATNVALIVGGARSDRAIMASFAAQEVPVAGHPLPRRLADPLQLGRYVRFLVRQIDEYRVRHPVKALKRALSLARIMLWPDWHERLLHLLQEPDGALAAAITARRELLRELGSREATGERQATVTALRTSLDTTIKDLEAARSGQDGADTSADAWASGQVQPTLLAFVDMAQDLIATP
ncbi:MAG: hypothetical protein FJW23_11050 [Acidimicrobiia bacterium]|nr:hypothetical protein [Acidimicrobiia bacterium]